MLRTVQGEIGSHHPPADVCWNRCLVRNDSNTHGHSTDSDCAVAHGASNLLRQAERFMKRSRKQYGTELVATVASEEVQARHGLADTLGDRAQSVVADRMAVPIIDQLKMVDIDHHQSDCRRA